MLDLIQRISNHFELAIVGMVGALASLRFHPDRKERNLALWFIATGAAIAYFTTNLVAEFFSIKLAHAGAVGFLLGAFGGSMFSAVMRAINAADLLALVKSWAGGAK